MSAGQPIISHRATTSSRHPGTVFRGSVRVYVAPLEQCPKCGTWFRDFGYAHAVTLGAGIGVKVDCTGAVVPR